MLQPNGSACAFNQAPPPEEGRRKPLQQHFVLCHGTGFPRKRKRFSDKCPLLLEDCPKRILPVITLRQKTKLCPTLKGCPSRKSFQFYFIPATHESSSFAWVGQKQKNFLAHVPITFSSRNETKENERRSLATTREQ